MARDSSNWRWTEEEEVKSRSARVLAFRSNHVARLEYQIDRSTCYSLTTLLLWSSCPLVLLYTFRSAVRIRQSCGGVFLFFFSASWLLFMP